MENEVKDVTKEEMADIILSVQDYAENEVVPADELEGTSSNVAVYAIVGGAIVAAATGAVLGGKKLIKKYKEKRLEKALKLVETEGYDVFEAEEPELIVDEAKSETEETSEENQEAPRRNKKRRR